jgi:integrase
VEQGILTANPALRLKRPEDERKSLPAPHLTVEEVGQLLAVSATDPLAAYWRVQVEAGLRPAEGLALCWLDVDLGAGIVTVRHALVRNNAGWELAPPKTHQQRAVAISPAAVELL